MSKKRLADWSSFIEKKQQFRRKNKIKLNKSTFEIWAILSFDDISHKKHK